ncbi:hypothetical protein TSOC_013822, partial [Tetrabaena socialis]
HFEGTHGLVLSNMSPGYVQQRPVLISRLLDLSSKLTLRDEVVHDAVLLMDRTASQAKQVSEDVLPLVGVAALIIAAKQGDSSDRVPTNGEIEQITGEPPAPATAAAPGGGAASGQAAGTGALTAMSSARSFRSDLSSSMAIRMRSFSADSLLSLSSRSFRFFCAAGQQQRRREQH